MECRGRELGHFDFVLCRGHRFPLSYQFEFLIDAYTDTNPVKMTRIVYYSNLRE